MIECPICGFANQEGSTYCRQCGAPLQADSSLISAPQPLPNGSKLKQGRYIIQKFIGQGGFGITYEAQDTLLSRKVAIKEMAPFGSTTRVGLEIRIIAKHPTQEGLSKQLKDFQEGKSKFLNEAQTLAKFKHPSIVRVYDYFEENNTAYMVMEFVEGKTLSALVSQKGRLREEEALGYIFQLCEALEEIHQGGYLHRDIKPENVIVTPDGKAVLVDFGIARQFAAAQRISMTIAYSDGYAPLEQYSSVAPFGPPTDIYALGATLYYLLTGTEPVSAPQRSSGVVLPPPNSLNPSVSETVSDAVMKAMSMRIEDRPQTIKEFLNLLKAPAKKAPVQQVQPVQQPISTPKVSILPSVSPSIIRDVGRRFGRVSGTLSGVVGGLAIGIIIGSLLILLSPIIGALAGAIAGAVGGGKEESCGTVLAGLIGGGVLGYYLGFYAGWVLAAGAAIGGLVYGGIKGVHFGSEMGENLAEGKGAMPASLLLSFITSLILGLSWMGFFFYVHPASWRSALLFAGLVTIVGTLFGSIVGFAVFWFASRKSGGQLPPQERLITLLTIPLGVGITYLIYYFAPHPQSIWLSSWFNWRGIIDGWKFKLLEMMEKAKELFKISFCSRYFV
jgi:serine/threonine protein kinase